MASVRSRHGHYIFALWSLLSSFFFFISSPNLSRRILDVYTWCGLSANLRCRSETCCTRLAENARRNLECGPMPNLMVALPNIGGAFCSTPQSLADTDYYMPCSNAAKTRNPLKLAGMPHTTGPISAAIEPMFTIL